jgi:hypothetical protein
MNVLSGLQCVAAHSNGSARMWLTLTLTLPVITAVPQGGRGRRVLLAEGRVCTSPTTGTPLLHAHGIRSRSRSAAIR